jgi:hypothetical protein
MEFCALLTLLWVHGAYNLGRAHRELMGAPFSSPRRYSVDAVRVTLMNAGIGAGLAPVLGSTHCETISPCQVPRRSRRFTAAVHGGVGIRDDRGEHRHKPG